MIEYLNIRQRALNIISNRLKQEGAYTEESNCISILQNLIDEHNELTYKYIKLERDYVDVSSQLRKKEKQIEEMSVDYKIAKDYMIKDLLKKEKNVEEVKCDDK